MEKPVKTAAGIVGGEIQREDVIRLLAEITRGRELETFVHEDRCCEMTVALGRRFLTAKADLLILAKGAQLHDVGKLMVPSEILNKPGRVNPHEYEKLQTHVTEGLRLVESLKLEPEILDMIAMHHERLDGSGYPRKLKAAALPLHARIVAVADMAEAMSSDRPYRRKLDSDVVMTLVEAQSGTALDADVVAALGDIATSGEIGWFN